MENALNQQPRPCQTNTGEKFQQRDTSQKPSEALNWEMYNNPPQIHKIRYTVD